MFPQRNSAYSTNQLIKQALVYSTTLAAVVLLFTATHQVMAQRLSRDEQTRGMRISPAGTESRVALVIGNSSYGTAPLRNPVNDANLVAATLRDLGFDVIARTNVSLREMQTAVRDFRGKIQNGSVALFYYAGHGIQADGSNYLIPIGASIEAEGDLSLEGLDLNSVLKQMGAAHNRLNIVILDACRNNPFISSSRGGPQGLAQVNAPAGTFIAYATAPGQTASDGKGQNGLYTQELLANMRTPGMPIEEVFKHVRVGVKLKSNGQQVPWDASSLEGSFSFVPGAGGAAAQSYAAAQPAYTQPAPTTPAPTLSRSTGVSNDLIESNFQSNLLDEVIKDGESFLSSQPDHARVNLRVGQSYFRKNQYSEAMPYLERAFLAGEAISLPVKRHRKQLGLYDDLDDGNITVTAAGLQMQFGSDPITLPFAQIERLEAQPDPVRGMLVYLKGTIVNKKGKSESKDYKLFAPTAEVVQAMNKYGSQAPVAICKGCESWTTEVVKFINRIKTSSPAKM